MSTVREYTPVEAAAICEVPAKAVYTAIDKKIILGRIAEHRGRVLSGIDLLRLVIWCRVGLMLSAEHRKAILDAISANPDAQTLQANDYLVVDLARVRERIAARGEALHEAESIVRIHKGLGGEPVFHDFDVAIRTIAMDKSLGASNDEIIKSYPLFTERMIELAEIWSAAHPPRGRPKKTSRPRAWREEAKAFESGGSSVLE